MHNFHPMMILPIVLLLIVLLWRQGRNISNTGHPLLRIGGALLFIALLGFAGCTNSDPLAVASGPVFALNPGHWQPLPRDLTVPAQVPNQ
jgi:hypothetical protein